MSSHFSFYTLHFQCPMLSSFPWYVLSSPAPSCFVILLHKIPTLDNLTLHLLSTFGKVDEEKPTTISTGLLKFITTNLTWAVSAIWESFYFKSPSTFPKWLFHTFSLLKLPTPSAFFSLSADSSPTCIHACIPSPLFGTLKINPFPSTPAILSLTYIINTSLSKGSSHQLKKVLCYFLP